jgi:hypothetical protein
MGTRRVVRINLAFKILPLFLRLLSINTNIGIYKITIVSVVLYGCEMWSLTLRKEHRLRVRFSGFLVYVHSLEFQIPEDITVRKLDLFPPSGEG